MVVQHARVQGNVKQNVIVTIWHMNRPKIVKRRKNGIKDLETS